MLQKETFLKIGKKEISCNSNPHYLEMIQTELYKKLMGHGLILPLMWHTIQIKFQENLVI